MPLENPLAKLSEEELVAAHAVQAVNNHFLTEMLRRHKVTTEDIGTKLERLNKLLLWFTIAIAGMTLVLVLHAVWTTFGH